MSTAYVFGRVPARYERLVTKQARAARTSKSDLVARYVIEKNVEAEFPGPGFAIRVQEAAAAAERRTELRCRLAAFRRSVQSGRSSTASSPIGTVWLRNPQLSRMRNLSTRDGANRGCLYRRHSSGLAVECHELDLEGLATGIDMNNRPDIADLQASVGHGRGQHAELSDFQPAELSDFGPALTGLPVQVGGELSRWNNDAWIAFDE